MKLNKKSYSEDILRGNMLRAIIGLAVPIFINSLLQTMYNLCDTYWLGKLGTEELAAINLITPLQNIVVNFGTGVTVAGSVLISQLMGANKKEKAREMTNQVFGCALVFSVFCALIILITAPFICTWLGATDDVWRFAKLYIQIEILDMPFLYMVNLYTSVCHAEGNSSKPVVLNTLGVIINVILDPVLMVFLNLGVAGAALATFFAKIVPALFALYNLSTRKSDELGINLKKIKFIKEDVKKIIKIGFPTAFGSSTMQFGFLLMTKNVLVYGTKAMAAYGIGNKINGLVSLPSNGIGSAVSTIVAQNVGAKQYDRADYGFKLSLRLIVTFLFIGGMILSRPFICVPIVQIFSDDSEVIMMAADFLSIMAFWVFANGFQNCTMGLFQGSGHTEITMINDIARLWIFRFASLYILEHYFHMGVRSIWYSVVISNGFAPLLNYIIYRTGYWKRERMNNKVA